MYPLNYDLIDGFSALFGEDFVRLGNVDRPVGSCAADALNLSEEFTEELRYRVREFKDAFHAFSNARLPPDSTRAATALDSVWETLYQIPPYRELSEKYLATHYVRLGFPELHEAALVEGTEEYEAVQEWLRRLTELPRAIQRFQERALEMLERYFPDDIERTRSRYARAVGGYQTGQHLIETALEDELSERSGESFFLHRRSARDELERRSFPWSFPVSVSYRAIPHPKNDGEELLAEQFEFRDWETFVTVDLFRGLAAGHRPRRCVNCGRWFLLEGGYNILYCGGPAPDAPGKTCRQVGAHRKEREANGAEGVRREYMRVYSRLKTRKNRGKISLDEWNRQVAEVQELRERAEAGRLTLKELVAQYDTF